jgi:hypothetical protein
MHYRQIYIFIGCNWGNQSFPEMPKQLKNLILVNFLICSKLWEIAHYHILGAAGKVFFIIFALGYGVCVSSTVICTLNLGKFNYYSFTKLLLSSKALSKYIFLCTVWHPFIKFLTWYVGIILNNWIAQNFHL